jgi:TnpA family transposase
MLALYSTNYPTKHTTQSVVVRKLSSYSRSNKTQKALWEYDKILKSLHTLRFIDDPSFRKSIRTALNRGEGYHQLTGKIASVNGSKFRGTTQLELFIWNECSRFVANCIIYYNALLLSKAYEIQEKLGNTQALEFIKRLSPIAWRHINFNGQYEFTSISTGIDLDSMVATLVFKFKEELTKG